MKGYETEGKQASPGQDLMIIGLAGMEGTRRIADLYTELISRRFAPGFLREQLKDTESGPDMLHRAMEILGSDISAWEAAEEGGVLAALWNLSGKNGCGIEFDLKKIPMKQITVEICELFHLNPYRLLSSGCIAAAADHGGWAAGRLLAEGIPAAVIGHITKGNARRMYHGGEEAGFLERPLPDEIEKIRSSGDAAAI